MLNQILKLCEVAQTEAMSQGPSGGPMGAVKVYQPQASSSAHARGSLSQSTVVELMLQNLTALCCSRCWTNCCWTSRETSSLAWLVWRQNAWWPFIILETWMLCMDIPLAMRTTINKRYHQSLMLNSLKEDLTHKKFQVSSSKILGNVRLKIKQMFAQS